MCKCKIIVPELSTKITSKKDGTILGELIAVAYHKDYKIYHVKNNGQINHYKIDEISLSTKNTFTIASDYNIGDMIKRDFVSYILVEDNFSSVELKYYDLFDDIISKVQIEIYSLK